MQQKLTYWWLKAFVIWSGLMAGSASAQTLGGDPNADRNVRLQIQLDRIAIKAFEPVYISISAEQFVQNPKVEVLLRKGVEPWQPVIFPHNPGDPDPWYRFESHAVAGLPKIKLGTVLLVGMVGERPRFLFSSPGDYKIRIKVGPDSTTLNLTVFTAAADDEKAATILGTDLFPHMFENDHRAKADPKLRDAAIRVAAEFPGSTVANYCQAYLHTVVFREESQKHEPPIPNPGVYGRLADKLELSAGTFSDTFFGEELSFYAAYAHGLNMDFARLLKVASNEHSALTPWADALSSLKRDVQKHLPKSANAPVPIQAPSN